MRQMTVPVLASILILSSKITESQIYHPFQSHISSKTLSLLMEEITQTDFSFPIFFFNLESTMEAKANNLMEASLKPCEAWTNCFEQSRRTVSFTSFALIIQGHVPN